MTVSAILPTTSTKKKKHLHYFDVSFLIVLLLISHPVNVMGDDTFCSESWSQVFFTDFIGGAIRSNGSYFSWGNNFYGSMGFGDTSTQQNTSGLVGSGSDVWQMIARNNYYTIGMKSDGSVHGWGWNTMGNLGSGAATFQLTPIQISAVGNCIWVATFGIAKTTFVVKSDKTLWAFGENLRGQMGTNPGASSSPIQIGTDSDWASVYASQQDTHVCAFKNGGSLYCWGENSNGQVGDGTQSDQKTPNLVLSSSDKWLGVYPVAGATIALHQNGTLFGWGSNQFAVLAQSDIATKLLNPTVIAVGQVFKAIAVAYNFVIAIASDGTLWGWGMNNYQQVNNDSLVARQMSPRQISSDTTWQSVYASMLYLTTSPGGSAFGIKGDGSLHGWGQNDLGQLGIGNNLGAVGNPTQVMPGRAFKSVYAAQFVVGAIDSNDELFIWGSNAFKQLADNSASNANKPLSCQDRSLVCSNHVCTTPCHPSCATCSGTSPNNCTSCSPPNYLNPLDHSCGPNCPNGYFQDSGQLCSQCNSNCATCSGTSANCTSCSPPNYLNPVDHTCGPSCPDGFFQDAGQVCSSCDGSCFKCNGPSANNCTACAAPNYLNPVDHSCGLNCPDGYFQDAGQVCSPCDGSCFKCNGPSANNCTECAAPNYLNPLDHSCGPNCPDGYFQDAGQACSQCQSPCANCNGTATNCTSCILPNFLYIPDHTCVNPCPDGFYGDSGSGQCQPCNSSCSKCNGPSANNCTACAAPNYLNPVDHSCGPNCPDGYFKDAGQVCSPCVGCAKCTGTATNCTACAAPNYLNSITHTCGPTCPDGYFGNTGQVCSQCQSPCVKCNGTATNCTACGSPNYLYIANHTCVNPCPNGYRGENSNRTCVANNGCGPECLACQTSTSTCMACIAGNPAPINGVCYPKCQGSFNTMGVFVCSSCDVSCNGCVNAAINCTSCASGYTRASSGLCVHIRFIRMRI